jgi:hypothetical protein
VIRESAEDREDTLSVRVLWSDSVLSTPIARARPPFRNAKRSLLLRAGADRTAFRDCKHTRHHAPWQHRTAPGVNRDTRLTAVFYALS